MCSSGSVAVTLQDGLREGARQAADGMVRELLGWMAHVGADYHNTLTAVAAVAAEWEALAFEVRTLLSLKPKSATLDLQSSTPTSSAFQP